jgi:uncharacterized protein YrrD
MTRNANELMSLPVISTQQGREVGRVKDVLFDPSAHQLLGLVVTATAAADATLFLERSAIKSLGEHAVTVESEDKLGAVTAYPRVREILDSGIHLKGAPVLTETGDAVGKVDKILVDEEGRIASYEVARGVLGLGKRKEITPSDVISIGQDAIIVSPSAAEERDEDDDDRDQHVDAHVHDDLSGHMPPAHASNSSSGANMLDGRSRSSMDEPALEPAQRSAAPTMAHTHEEAEPGEVETTRDHETIRRWAESRGGRAAEVQGTGILRIAFHDDPHLEPLPWEQFFEKFDASASRFVYSTQPASDFYAFTT